LPAASPELALLTAQNMRAKTARKTIPFCFVLLIAPSLRFHPPVELTERSSIRRLDYSGVLVLKSSAAELSLGLRSINAIVFDKVTLEFRRGEEDWGAGAR
jgi:hypothetical protein